MTASLFDNIKLILVSIVGMVVVYLLFAPKKTAKAAASTKTVPQSTAAPAPAPAPAPEKTTAKAAASTKTVPQSTAAPAPAPAPAPRVEVPKVDNSISKTNIAPASSAAPTVVSERPVNRVAPAAAPVESIIRSDISKTTATAVAPASTTTGERGSTIPLKDGGSSTISQVPGADLGEVHLRDTFKMLQAKQQQEIEIRRQAAIERLMRRN